MLDQDEDQDLLIPANVPYRPVTNRAGRTIMAKPGARRCRHARGPECVYQCGGINHGIHR